MPTTSPKLRLSAVRAVALALLIVGAASAALPALAAPRGTGLPLPRFVSIRASEVNLRTGPGVQYPVDWVYRRQNLPMEVIAEFRTWRKVRDWQGAQGWIHQSMLGGRRTMIVTGEERVLRARPAASGDPVARLQPGVIGTIVECPDATDWCRAQAGGFEGWLRRVDFWGIHDGEVVR